MSDTLEFTERHKPTPAECQALLGLYRTGERFTTREFLEALGFDRRSPDVVAFLLGAKEAGQISGSEKGGWTKV